MSSNKICVDDEKITQKIKENKHSMLTTNIRSLPKHFSELESIIGEFKPDVVTLAEVWKPYKAGVTIENYNEIITKLRPNGTRGGEVGIYLSKKYK